LVTKRAFERQPVLARRHAEELMVELVEPPELLDRALVIVDAEVDGDVGELPVPAVSPRDEERRRLLAAAVAAGGLRRREALEQPGGEARARTGLEGRGESVHGVRAGEDVSLSRVAGTRPLPGPTEPRSRNLDCTATPHSDASRSQAAIEYVATIIRR